MIREGPLRGLFRQPWWLDATAGVGNWGEVCVCEGGRQVAFLQFALRRKLGMTILGMPPLTATLGPALAPMEGKDGSLLLLLGAFPGRPGFGLDQVDLL